MLRPQTFLVAMAIIMSGCSINDLQRQADNSELHQDSARYEALEGERFPVPAVNLRRFNPKYMRQEVEYATAEPPGTIIVDSQNYFLYLTLPGGRALRYGIGVGREGFGWNGSAIILHKAEWPKWTPPAEMIARDPQAAVWANGMPGGPENPLGARALYLFQNGRDTLYRIHGTIEPRSIGQSMSSGCIRLLNQDIIDLYRRVPMGSRVVVLPNYVSPPADIAAPTSGGVSKG